MPQRLSTLIGLSTHSHLHTITHHVCSIYRYKWLMEIDKSLLLWLHGHFVDTHLCLKELFTMAFRTSRSPMWDGPRKWNMSMLLRVGWALHKRLGRDKGRKVLFVWCVAVMDLGLITWFDVTLRSFQCIKTMLRAYVSYLKKISADNKITWIANINLVSLIGFGNRLQAFGVLFSCDS